MIPQGLFTQIGLVIVSIAIVVTYIKPIFGEIGDMQKDIEVYSEKRASINEVNAKLTSLTKQMDDVSIEDRVRLDNYMPYEVDSISVVRDLFIISNEAGVFYIDGQYTDESAKNKRSSQASTDEAGADMPKEHIFDLSVEGTYSQIKSLIGLIEQNHYPLEIRSMIITQVQSGFLFVNLSLATYSYNDEAIISESN